MKILDKRVIGEGEGTRIIRIEVEAGAIARKAQAGQFVVLMVSPVGERIPLTVVSADRERSSIGLIFQEAGLTTTLLGKAQIGQELHALTGPLGVPTQIRQFGRVLLVAGGVGIAEAYPVARALKEAGNHLTAVVGCRSAGLLILEEEIRAQSDILEVATDDGSRGREGFVSDILSSMLPAQQFDLAYAVGPLAMMQRVAMMTKEAGIRTIVSLNALMVDATGMCGSCRVTVRGETRFSCIDGPEFEASDIDWQELSNRNRMYTEKEGHVCKLRVYP